MTGLPRIASLLVPVLLVGCDPWVVEVGRGQVTPVVVERIMVTGLTPEDGCPSARVRYRTFDDRYGDATVAPLSQGCLLAFREDDVELMPADVIGVWREQLRGVDLTALLAVELIVDSLEIFDDSRQLIPLEDLDSVSLHLDGQVLFTREDMASMNESELRVPVPEELIERFLLALESGDALTAEMEIRMVFGEGVPIPNLMRVRAELQPILKVDAWKVLFQY